MRHLLLPALAACMLIGCDLQPALREELPAGPDPAHAVPRQVQELVDEHGVTDREIAEGAERAQTDVLWPPAPAPSYSVYAVTFIWGHLLGERNPPFPVVDWSGELSVSGTEASLKVVRLIDFEDGEDYLLPVAEPARLAWVSKTAGDFDGLGLLIRVPAASAADSASAALSFKTPAFAASLPFAKLERFVAYYPVDDTHGVAILARRVHGLACPRGFIKGQWVPEAGDGGRGSLRGTWYDLFGIPVGSMAGSFWTDPDGTGRFEGWLSGVYLTVVLAEIEGTWCHDGATSCSTRIDGRGRLEGTYRYLNAERKGAVQGRFGDSSPGGEERTLTLVGTWRDDCLRTTPQ